jgi:hypothetical protein
MSEDPFHVCDLDEIFALTCDQSGLDGLKTLLAQVDLDSRSSIEIAKLLRDNDLVRQKAYLAHLYRKGQIILADLVPQGVDPETIAYVDKSRK